MYLLIYVPMLDLCMYVGSMYPCTLFHGVFMLDLCIYVRSVYLCIYVSMCLCIYISMCLQYASMHLCMYISMYACIHVCMCLCICTCSCMYIYIFVSVWLVSSEFGKWTAKDGMKRIALSISVFITCYNDPLKYVWVAKKHSFATVGTCFQGVLSGSS